jgi:hypothetical protein
MIKTVFLQKDFNLTIDENVNIILSPELYWVRIFDIPINSKKEALSVLPNMFEDFFDVDGYKFYLEKLEDGKYLSFAYNEQEVKQCIENVGLSLKQVSNIYFAQFECQGFQSFSVDGTNYMYQDDILVKIPSNFVFEDSFLEIDLETIKLTKHSFFINKSSKYIDSKTAYILSALFVVLAGAIFAKSFILDDMNSKIPNKIENIKQAYNLMPTLFQTKSLIKEYTKVDKRYTNLRNILEYCLNFKSAFSGIIEKVELKNNQLIVIYNEANYSNVRNYITKKYKKASVEQLSSKVKVRIGL